MSKKVDAQMAQPHTSNRFRQRAEALNEQLKFLLPRLASLSFDEFVTANRRPSILDELINHADQLYIFRERARHSNFKFSVSYSGQDRGPLLTAYGERNYLGLILSARAAEAHFRVLERIAADQAARPGRILSLCCALGISAVSR